MAWTDWNIYRERFPEDTDPTVRMFQYGCESLATIDLTVVPRTTAQDIIPYTPFFRPFGQSRIVVTVPPERVDWHIANSGVTLQWSIQLDSIRLQPQGSLQTTTTLATWTPYSSFYPSAEAFVYHAGVTSSLGITSQWAAMPAYFIGSIDPTNPPTYGWYGSPATIPTGKLVWERESVVLQAGSPLTIDLYFTSESANDFDVLRNNLSLWTDLATCTGTTLEQSEARVRIERMDFTAYEIARDWYIVEGDEAYLPTDPDVGVWGARFFRHPEADPTPFVGENWSSATLITTSLCRGVSLTGALDSSAVSFITPLTTSLSGMGALWFGWDNSSDGLDQYTSLGPLAYRSTYVLPASVLTGSTGPALILPVVHQFGEEHASPGTFEYKLDGTQDCKGWIGITQGSLTTVIQEFDYSPYLSSIYRDPIGLFVDGSLTTAAATAVSLDFTQPVLVETRLVIGKPREWKDYSGPPVRLGFALGLSGGTVGTVTRQTSVYQLEDTSELYPAPRACSYSFYPLYGQGGDEIYGYQDPVCISSPVRVIQGRSLCGEAASLSLESEHTPNAGSWLNHTAWLFPEGVLASLPATGYLPIVVDVVPTTICTNPDLSNFVYGTEIQGLNFTALRGATGNDVPYVRLSSLGTYTGVYGPTVPVASFTMSIQDMIIEPGLDGGWKPGVPFVLNLYTGAKCAREDVTSPEIKLVARFQGENVRAGSQSRKFLVMFGEDGSDAWDILNHESFLRFATSQNTQVDRLRVGYATNPENRDTVSDKSERVAADSFLRLYDYATADGLVVDAAAHKTGQAGINSAIVATSLVEQLSEPGNSNVILLTSVDKTWVEHANSILSVATVLVILASPSSEELWIANQLTSSSDHILQVADWSDTQSIVEWLSLRIPGHDIFQWSADYTYNCYECEPVACEWPTSTPYAESPFAPRYDGNELVYGTCQLQGTLTDGKYGIVGALVTATNYYYDDTFGSYRTQASVGITDAAGAFTLCIIPGATTLEWCSSPWHYHQSFLIGNPAICPPPEIDLVSRPWVGTVGALVTASYTNNDGVASGLQREYSPILTGAAGSRRQDLYGWTYWCDTHPGTAQVIAATLMVEPVSLATPGSISVRLRTQDRGYDLGVLYSGNLPTTGVSIPLDIIGRYSEDDHFPFEVLATYPVSSWAELPVYAAVTGLTAYPNQDLPDGAATLYVDAPGIYELSPGGTSTEDGVWFQARVVRNSEDTISARAMYLVQSSTVPTSLPTVATITDLNFLLIPPWGGEVHGPSEVQSPYNLTDNHPFDPVRYGHYVMPGEPFSTYLFQSSAATLERYFIVVEGAPLATINVSVDLELLENSCDEETPTATSVESGWLYQFADTPLTRFTLATGICAGVSLQVTTFEREVAIGDDSYWLPFTWIDPSVSAPAEWEAAVEGYYAPHISGVRTRSDCDTRFTWYGACTPSTVLCSANSVVTVVTPIGTVIASLVTSTNLDRVAYAISPSDPQGGEDGGIYAIENPGVTEKAAHWCYYLSSEIGSETVAHVQMQLDCAERLEGTSAWGWVTATTRTGTQTLATFDTLSGQITFGEWAPVSSPTLSTWAYAFPLAPSSYYDGSYHLGFPPMTVALDGELRLEAWAFQVCGATLSWKINPGVELSSPAHLDFLYESFDLTWDLCCETQATLATLNWIEGESPAGLTAYGHDLTNEIQVSTEGGYAHAHFRRDSGALVTVTPVISAIGPATLRLFDVAAWIVQDGVTLATYSVFSTMASAATISAGVIATLPDVILDSTVDLDLYVARPCVPGVEGYNWELQLSLGTPATLLRCWDTWWLDAQLGELTEVHAVEEVLLEVLASEEVRVSPTFIGCGADAISYSITGLPTGVSCAPVTGLGPVTLTLLASATAATGVYPINFVGYGGTTVSTPATLRLIRAGGDWDFSLDPENLTIIPGQSGAASISISRWNYDDPVTFATVDPSGITSTTDGVAVQVVVASATGSQTVSVVGTSLGETKTHELGITIPPQDFSLLVTPGTLQVEIGDTITGAVSAIRTGGFSGNIELSTVGYDAVFDNPTIGSSSLFSVVGLTVGTYPMEVVGTAGALTRSTLATIEVFPLGSISYFEIVPEITSLSIAPTDTRSLGLWLSRTNLTGLASLTVTPEVGFSFELSPNPAGSTSLLDISTEAVVVGLYSIEVTGVIGARTAACTVLVEVTNDLADYAIEVDPAYGSCVDPGLLTTEVTLIPYLGYSGSQVLTTGLLPTGVTVGFIPQTLATTSMMSVYVDGCSIGIYSIEVIAGSRSTTYEFSVREGVPLFSIASEGCVSIGEPFAVAITLHQIPVDGFEFSVAGLPSGLTATWSPESNRVRTELLIGGTCQPGVYSLDISASAMDETARCYPYLVVPASLAPDFYLTSQPMSLVLEPGWNGFLDVDLVRVDGFAESVAFSALATGLTIEVLSAVSMTGTRLLVSAATPLTTDVIVVGRRGGKTRELRVPVTVLPAGEAPAFVPWAEPRSITDGRYSTNYVELGADGYLGWDDTVEFTVTSVPAGVSAVIDGSTLAISVGDLLPNGDIEPVIIAVFDALGVTRELPLKVNLLQTADDPYFALAFPAARVASTGICTIPVDILEFGGFSGAVTLTLNGGPLGSDCVISNNSLVITANSTPIGEYVLSITGESGSIESTVTNILQVSGLAEDYILQLQNPTVICRAGDETEAGSGITAQTRVSVVGYGGFSESVLLTCLSAPFAGSVWMSEPSTSSWATVNVWVESGVESGSYEVVIEGSSNSDIIRRNILTVNVPPVETPSFSLLLSSSPATETQHDIEVVGYGGFAGTVAFGMTGLPTGATVGFSPLQSMSASTLQLYAGSAAPGIYDLWVTGSSGVTTHRTPLTWKIEADSPTPCFITSLDSPLVGRKGDVITSEIISLTLHGFSNEVITEFEAAPALGLISSSNPLELELSRTVSPGNYTITMRSGDGSYTIEKWASVSVLTGDARGYGISLSPSASFGWPNDVLSITLATCGYANFSRPTTVSLSFPAGITGAYADGVLEVTLTSLATMGLYEATVTVEAGATQFGTQVPIVVLSDNLEDGYSLRLTPSLVSSQRTGQATYQVDQYNYNHWDDLGVLSASGLPSEIVAEYGEWQHGEYSTCTISLTRASVGVHAYNVLSSASSQTVSASAWVQVLADQSDFYLMASPESLSLRPGESGTASLTVVPLDGFDETVELSLTTVPAELVVSLAEGELLVEALVTSTLGEKVIVVTGTSESKIRTLQFPVTVRLAAADFIINVEDFALEPCGLTEVPIEIIRYGGFTEAISLTLSSLGATGYILPNTAAGTAATMYLRPRHVAPGIYGMTVTGTGGGIESSSVAQMSVPSSDSVFWVHMDDGRHSVPGISITAMYDGPSGTGMEEGTTDTDGWLGLCIPPGFCHFTWGGDWHYSHAMGITITTETNEIHLHSRPHVWNQGLTTQEGWELLSPSLSVVTSSPKVHWPVYVPDTGSLRWGLGGNAQILAATLHIVAEEARFIEVGRDEATLNVWERSTGTGQDPIQAEMPYYFRGDLLTACTISIDALTISFGVTTQLRGLLDGGDCAFEVGAWFPIQDPNYIHDQIKCMMFDPGPAYGGFMEWNPETEAYDLGGFQNIAFNYYGPMEDRWVSGAYPEGFRHGGAIKIGTFGDAPEGTPDWANYPGLVSASTASSMSVGPVGSAPLFPYTGWPGGGGEPWGTYCKAPIPPSRLDAWEGSHPGRYLAWPAYHYDREGAECYPGYGTGHYEQTESGEWIWVEEGAVDQFPFLWSSFQVDNVTPGHRYFFLAQQPAGYWANNMPPGGWVAFNIWAQVVPLAADIVLYTGATGMTISFASHPRDFDPWTCAQVDPLYHTGQLPPYDGLQIHNMEERTHCELTVPWRTHAPDSLYCCDSSTIVPVSDFTYEDLRTGYVRYGPAPDCGVADNSYEGRSWLRDWSVVELTDYVEPGKTFRAVAVDPQNSVSGWDYIAKWQWWVGQARWVTVGPELLPVSVYLEVEWHHWPCHNPMQVEDGGWVHWERDGVPLNYSLTGEVVTHSYSFGDENVLLTRLDGGTLVVRTSDDSPATSSISDDAGLLYSGALPVTISLDYDRTISGSATLNFYAETKRDVTDWSELPYQELTPGTTLNITDPGRYLLFPAVDEPAAPGDVLGYARVYLTTVDPSFEYYLIIPGGTGADVYYGATLLTPGTVSLAPASGAEVIQLVANSLYADFGSVTWVTVGPVVTQTDAFLSIEGFSSRAPVGDTYVSKFEDDEWTYYQSNVPLAGIETAYDQGEIDVELLDQVGLPHWDDLHLVDPEMYFRRQKWDSYEVWMGPGRTFYPVATKAIRWSKSTPGCVTWLGSCEEPIVPGTDIGQLRGVVGEGSSVSVGAEPVYRTGLPEGAAGMSAFVNHGLAAALLGQVSAGMVMTSVETEAGYQAAAKQLEILLSLAKGQNAMGNLDVAERILQQARAAGQILGLSIPSVFLSGISGDAANQAAMGVSVANMVAGGSTGSGMASSTSPMAQAMRWNVGTLGLTDALPQVAAYKKNQQASAAAAARRGDAPKGGRQDNPGSIITGMRNFVSQLVNRTTSLRIADSLGTRTEEKPIRQLGNNLLDRLPSMWNQITSGRSWQKARPLAKGQAVLGRPDISDLPVGMGLPMGVQGVDPGLRNIGPALGLLPDHLPESDELRRMQSMYDGPLAINIRAASGPIDMDVVNQELKRRL